MIAGIILAGGKGTRLKSVEVNKVTLPFAGKPMIQYGVDLIKPFVSQLIIVIGSYADSVKEVLRDYDVEYVMQDRQLGTGHAVQVALPHIHPDTEHVLVGYGDHMMFYKTSTVRDMLQKHIGGSTAVTLITTNIKNPPAYGRILRDASQEVYGIVEEKDATPEQRLITEINAGFYCFNSKFLQKYLPKLKPSPVTQEYYLTDMVGIAVEQKLGVIGFEVPYRQVGIGINTREELEASQKLYTSSDQ